MLLTYYAITSNLVINRRNQIKRVPRMLRIHTRHHSTNDRERELMLTIVRASGLRLSR